MNAQIFDRMLEEIYSAFGREKPKFGSGVYRNLWRRVVEERGVPDEAAKAIAYAASNWDSLPVNIGKAILNEFSTWLDANPNMRAAARCCPDCSKDIPGFFWVWVGGSRKVCKCACNDSERIRHWQAWTRGKAERSGYLLADPAQAPVQSGLGDFSAAIGAQKEKPRRDHVRQLEAANW